VRAAEPLRPDVVLLESTTGERPHGDPHAAWVELHGYFGWVITKRENQPTPETKRRNGRGGQRTKREEAFLAQTQPLNARHYVETVIETVPPLLILDLKLRVLTANKSFCKSFRISSRQTVNRLVYDLGNGQWNIPKLRRLLEEILPRKNTFKACEVTHNFEALGTRTMLLSGRQVDHLQRIVLFIEDVTEQRAAQSALRASELRYRRLFESARDGILILDPQTRKITDANPFMSELLGYPHEELLGKELWEIGLLKDEKANRLAFRELRKKHYIRYEDLPLQNKSGQRREVEFVSNLYEAGRRKVIQCNIRDITKRKHFELSLRESEKRFHAIFAHATIGIAQTDSDGYFTMVNKCFCEITRRKENELIGIRMQEIAHPADCARNNSRFKKLKARGGSFVIEERFVQPSGEIVWVRSSVSRVDRTLESSEYFIAVTLDITDEKRAERAILAAKDEIGRHAVQMEHLVEERTAELQKTIRELEGFSYSVSHDMRAPLRAMQSFAQFLVEEYATKLDEQGVRYLQQIMRSAVRLDRLIQDVLSYTKILHGKLPMERVDLDRLVRDLVETFPNGQPIKPEIQIKNVLPEVMGNEALLGQCVSNLLSNGAKFVSLNTTPQLEIWSEPIEGGAIRVWFKDNGIGVAPENHDRIFRLFERINPSSDYEGTGIGLSIVRKATERMGALMGFESALGKGTKFWIELKKAKP
jgi:PAS domain S-box-containing protein